MHDDTSETSSPVPEPPRPRAIGPLGWVIRYTRGLIHDQHLRRLTMFYVIIAAMVMAFVGELFLDRWLHQNPWRFLGYYLVCAWLTLVAALLALYDLLMLRLQHRLIRRELRLRMLGEDHEPKE